MATDTTGQVVPGFLRLPQDIMELVIDELPEKDLTSLRLVCKGTASKSARLYAKTFFTERTFVLSPRWSMQTSQDIKL